jgi:hypothetical protein
MAGAERIRDGAGAARPGIIPISEKSPPKMACEQCLRDWHRPNRREPDGLGSRMILRALTLPWLSRDCRLKTEKLHEQQHRSAGQREYRRGRETLQHHCAPQPKVEATVIE